MSHASIEANIVITACKKYISEWEQKRLEHKESIIKKRMDSGFLGLGIWKISRDKAINALENDGWNSYNLNMIFGSYWIDKTRSLLKLAQSPGVTCINVDDKMAFLFQ